MIRATRTPAKKKKVRMTYQEFLTALRKSYRRWKFVNGNEIRTVAACHCPITAVSYKVFGEFFEEFMAEDAAKFMGLPTGLADKIVKAADSHTSNLETSRLRRIRRDLLEAVGLKEIGEDD